MPTLIIWLMVSLCTFFLTLAYAPSGYVGNIRDALWRRIILVVMWPASLLCWLLGWITTVITLTFEADESGNDDPWVRDAMADLWYEFKCLPYEFRDAWNGEPYQYG